MGHGMAFPASFITILFFAFLFSSTLNVFGQNRAPGKPSAAPRRNNTSVTQARVSLTPRFSPGQTFRYETVYETTTTTSRSGIATDPQGPSKLVITWHATIRLDVLPGEAAVPGGIRLRITYEKSAADLRSDTFDPNASTTQDQYQKLEGKILEFALDGSGNVTGVSGLEGIVEGDKALQSARAWIAQLAAGPGAPVGGVIIGQKWSSDQAATSLPVAGMVWRAESQYLRNESCHPANPDGSSVSANNAPDNLDAFDDCAVILTELNLVRPRPVRDPTPEELRKNGVRTSGTWNGSAQSLSHISLRSGLIVSLTQTGSENMDVTLTTERLDSLHYAGTILSRSQVALVADKAQTPPKE